LFEGKEFVGVNGTTKQLSNSQYWVKVNESYEVEVPDKYEEVCDKVNKTNICNQFVSSYKNITKIRQIWSEYNYEILKAGNYEWKLTGNKDAYDNVDFRIISNSETLDEWAWWNSSWDKKKEIKVEEKSASALTNYTTLIYVTYDSDMQTDFDDLRFLNGTEDIELGYWIENKSDGNYAYVWVDIPTLTASINTSIYMYYNNSVTSTTSDRDDVWKDAVTDQTSYTWDQTYGSETNYLGSTFTASTNLIVLGAGDGSSQTATKVYIYNSSSTLLDSATISSHEAAFTTFISSSADFNVVSGKDGSTYTSQYDHSPSGGYPVTLTNVVKKSGCFFHSGTTIATTTAWGGNIEWIETDERASTEPSIVFGAEEELGTAPTLTANATSPSTVFTNTTWLVNLTATDPEESNINVWTQFYVDDVKTGGLYYYNLTNATNEQVAELGSGNFSSGNVLIAEVILGDGNTNSTAVNISDTVWINPVATDTISYYKIDEASGTAYDVLGDYNLTNTGVAMNQAGIIETSGLFARATTDKLRNTNFATDFKTINMWVNLISMANSDTLFVLNDGTDDIQVYYAGGLSFSSWDGAGMVNTGNVPFTSYLNKWTMVTAVENTTHMILYLDGSQVGIVATNWNAHGTTTLTIGNHAYLSRSPAGKIDEVGVWSRALNSTEITELYNSEDGFAYPFDPVNAAPTLTANATSPSTVFTNTTWLSQPNSHRP